MASNLLNGIVAYYKLDSTTDSTGNGHTLTNTGSVAFNTTGANSMLGGGAIFVAGNTKALRAGNPLSFTSSGSMTWNFWVKATTFAGWAFDTNTLTSTKKRTIIMNTASTFELWTNTGALKSSATESTSTWYMVTVTGNISTGAYNLYVNGVPQGGGTSVAASTNTFSDFSIGNAVDGLTAEMNGFIAAFGVWTRVLTGIEITQLYNGGSGLQYPLTTTNNGIILNA